MSPGEESLVDASPSFLVSRTLTFQLQLFNTKQHSLIMTPDKTLSVQQLV